LSIKDIKTSAPIYWRRHVITANTIGVGEGETLPIIRNALPIRQGIAYINFAGMGRNGNIEFYRKTLRSNFK
jgi:hypothetical protein